MKQIDLSDLLLILIKEILYLWSEERHLLVNTKEELLVEQLSMPRWCQEKWVTPASSVTSLHDTKELVL